MNEDMDSASSSSGVSTIERTNQVNDKDKINELSAEIANLREIVYDQKQQIDDLTSKQANINNRLRTQERYTRKDSILVVNPPFDARKTNDVTFETLRFFEKYLDIKLPYDSIKACHILPGKLKDNVLPTIICKFLYFDHKNDVWKKKWKLRKNRNSVNNLNIYLREPLPECEAEIHTEAKKRNLVVSTNNCVVSVLVKDGEKKFFKKVNDINELDTLNVVKRNNDDKNDDLPDSKRFKK